MDTLERVSYQLKAGVNLEEFVKANEAISNWAKTQPGFQYRSLSQQEDGSWLDLVFWQSKEQAEAAMAKSQQEPLFGSFMEYVQEGTIDMGHNKIHLSAMAEE